MRIKNFYQKEYKREKYNSIWGWWFEDHWSKKSKIWSFKYREYRSWKYNRKTQYKL